ncbi:MAG: YceI family protein [Gammaproteobacteria bacterium]
MLGTGHARADKYAIDTKMGHAFVNFKFRHLGYSILAGTFEKFSGEFDWDPEDVTASSVSVEIETKSLNSNHAERDRHIREEKYLDTDRFPRAVFRSTRVDASGDGGMIIHGDLTLRGITREISIAASPIAAGNDPWGGYRAGFEGYVTLDMREFGVSTFVPGHTVDMELFVEGVRQ